MLNGVINRIIKNVPINNISGINRNTLDKKAYIRNVTNEMKEELIGKIEYCDNYVKQLKAPPKPADVSKKACSYCAYKTRCGKDGD